MIWERGGGRAGKGMERKGRREVDEKDKKRERTEEALIIYTGMRLLLSYEKAQLYILVYAKMLGNRFLWRNF